MDETDVEFEKSTKGINAEWMMVISGGEIIVNSASHAIHCQDEIEITGKFKAKKMFNVIIKYIAPVCIILILISSVLDALGIMKI